MPEQPIKPDVAGKSPGETADNEAESPQKPKEYGGPAGKEPTRYGDWEKNGRCIDF